MVVIDEATNMDLVIAAVQSAMRGEDVVIVVNGMAVSLVPVESQVESSPEEDQADIEYVEKTLADPSTEWMSLEEVKKQLGYQL
jgi:antitoxin (DNA-binding transcriptional repressor) of toxin-antitoxin stability system